ncbi:hypothetical protein Goshw_024222, partial [Gossypium schwendimanii]|nr:hypothetical protein [Gossypium schwendimanii]
MVHPYTFKVMMDENSSRVRTVHFNTITMEIHCTCKKFDFCSYLCSHALRILSVKNVNKISYWYISRRWTKDAKKNMYGGNVKILYEGDMEVEKELTKLCVSKNHKLNENETNARVVIRSKNVKRSIIKELSSNDDNIVKQGESKTSSILDSPHVKPKGISNLRFK